MALRFQHRYRITSARLAGWDYATPGAYFVTWCTAHRQRVLGGVAHRQMHLSALGALVQEEAQRLAYGGVVVDALVVMPDHVHLLVVLEAPAPRLAVVVGALKANVTRRARREGRWGAAALWQPRFWDRIVRSEAERVQVRRYIAQNPARWSP